MGLIDIPKDDLIYIRLQPLFPKSIIEIDKDNRETLSKLGEVFRVFQQKAALVRFILINMHEKGWLQAMKGILYYKKQFVQTQKTAHSDIDMIMVDANRAFVLYCCTMVNKHLAKNEADKALEFATIACYDTVQMLEENDNHYKQVLQNLEQSYSLGRRLLS